MTDKTKIAALPFFQSEAGALLAYCRPGFEKETAQELSECTGQALGDISVPALTGYVLIPLSDKPRMWHMPAFVELVFARQLLQVNVVPMALESRDWVTPIADAIKNLALSSGKNVFSALWLEYPDTNEGKALSSRARHITPHIELALQCADISIRSANPANEMDEVGTQAPRLHVFLTPDRFAYVGVTDPANASPWPLGIPRLRMPAGAPSRSTLKLAEALHVFLGEDEQRLLRPGMRAVDLGAAPGGWTWQLVHRGLQVTTVDNGNLKGDLIDNALVRHLREDGFRFVPRRPVDWLVCDMVEQPVRIARLVAHWIRHGWAQQAIFNLKLPMKKRYEELQRCRTLIEEEMAQSGIKTTLRFRHLYHDREEVTGYMAHTAKCTPHRRNKQVR